MPPPLPPTMYVMLLQSLMIVTSTMMMSVVNCYDDQSGFCAGPAQNVCRHSLSELPAGVTQYTISFRFHARAFDSPTVCRRLYGLPSAPANFEIYAYFSCNLANCYQCYHDAFMDMINNDECYGKDGAVISLDGCCLRYETYNFCGAHN
ncbi:hypothetical protein LINGRAHAP2_LOCUS26155 [Linum grandiflorum]